MTDRPITFSAPMVRALLEGRKTQTRRIIKDTVPQAPRMDAVNPKNAVKHPAPYLDAYCSERKTTANPRGMSANWCWWTRDDRQCLPGFRVGYVPGDRLWVRESFKPIHSGDPSRGAKYKADLTGNDQTIWKPSIHMPRWASRLTLLVTGVKVERLQDISREDAIAEGIVEDDGDVPDIWYCPGGYKFGVKRMASTPGEAFRHLWEGINGPESWEANPWVVAVSFEVTKENIDSLPRARAA